MRHQTAIPHDLHVDLRPKVKDALGSFWSTVFGDQDLVDGELAARVLSAAQLYIDVLEALDLRDHTGSPVFHREHWHPVVIRKSMRNKARGLTVGMPDARIGAQTVPTIYKDGEIFRIGGNAEYSKVYTYPLESGGRRLVHVTTCICDSIDAPTHLLTEGKDFALEDGILVIRQEQDPFEVEGYRLVDDGEDLAAVLWVCDGAYDAEYVADFLGYPLGFNVRSTPAASRMLAAVWDAVTYGLTPRYLNAILGAVFDVPVVVTDTVLESIGPDHDGFTDLVTADRVYRVATAHRRPDLTVGMTLTAGDFLTTDLSVTHSLSPAEFLALVEDQTIGSLSLPPGCVAGCSETVILDAGTYAVPEGQAWFPLNAGDTADSPFWTAVRARTPETELVALVDRLAGTARTVNPLKALGYAALCNTVLIRTDRPLCTDPCAPLVFQFLSTLIPASASLLAIQTVEADTEAVDAPQDEGDEELRDFSSVEPEAEEAGDASDAVSFSFRPMGATEV